MAEYVLLILMAALVVGLLFLRTNIAVGYLALCAGSVLLLASGDNAGLVASSLTSGMGSAAMVAKLLLLFTPLAVCAVLLRGQMRGLTLVLGIIPAICTALLGTVLAVPLLSESTKEAVTVTNTWALLVQYQEAFTGLGLVLSICLLAITVKRPHDKHHKKRH